MSYLLDTHVLIWWFANHKNLQKSVRAVIEDSEAAIHVSTASMWEIALNKRLRLQLVPSTLPELLARHRFRPLDVRMAHVIVASKLPPVHSDPFDRMLIAQANFEGLTLITSDRHIKRYDVKILPA